MIKDKVSVRNLVEFIYKSGDLNNTFQSSSRAIEGTRIHQKIQNEYNKKFNKNNVEIFLKEFYIKKDFNFKEFNIEIEGRIDGILNFNNTIEILEIKSTNINVASIKKEVDVHMAQAKIYGYIYSLLNNLDTIDITLLYVNVDDFLRKEFKYNFGIKTLEDFFYNTLNIYYKWLNFNSKWIEKRNSSIKNLKFPFKTYRKYQRELAVTIYNSIKNKKNLYVEAPTGIGKTISTIFPSLKLLGENFCEKIFYLTAKSNTKTIAENTINILKDKNLNLRFLTITAKEKICFKEKCECNSEYCEYAKGYFDRLKDCIYNILSKEESITKEILIKYCKKYTICPFETSIILINYCDFIICDYNYIFDTNGSFINDNNKNIFLVDEAHNLVDRSREMYSESFFKSEVLNLKKQFTVIDSGIYKALTKINKQLIELKDFSEEKGFYTFNEKPTNLINSLKEFIIKTDLYFGRSSNYNFKEELLDFYFKANKFCKIGDNFNDNYIFYSEKQGKDLFVKLFCLNPKDIIKNVLKDSISTIFFSATLCPISYYKEILGGNEDDYNLTLKCPFPIENREVLICNNISTKFKDRNNTYDKIIHYIYSLTSLNHGNYIVFFPSYEYMEEVYFRFKKQYNNLNLKIQSSVMTEKNKEDFLKNFKENNVIAFCVLGGSFSEGIDLKGTSLIGTIIVGVGLPKISLERDFIKNHFNKVNNLGFHYAYTFPGMNKVIQAAGRVIRSDTDKGIILLIDDRFNLPIYKSLFPKYWTPYTEIKNIAQAENIANNFFNN